MGYTSLPQPQCQTPALSLSPQHLAPRYPSASKSPFVCFPDPWLYKYHLIKLGNEARKATERAERPRAGSAQPLNERWALIPLPTGDKGDRSSNFCDAPKGPSSLRAPQEPTGTSAIAYIHPKALPYTPMARGIYSPKVKPVAALPSPPKIRKSRTRHYTKISSCEEQTCVHTAVGASVKSLQPCPEII